MEGIFSDLAFWALSLSIFNTLLLVLFWLAVKSAFKKHRNRYRDNQEKMVSNTPSLDEKFLQFSKIEEIFKNEQKILQKLEKNYQELQKELHEFKEQVKKNQMESSVNKEIQEKTIKKENKEPALIQEYAFTPSEQGFKIENLKKDFNNDNCFFVIEYQKDKNFAEFYIHPDSNLKKLIKYWDQYRHVVEEENKSEAFTKRILNLEKGKLNKENLYWVVSKKLKIKYE